MSPEAKPSACGDALTEMEVKARELSRNGGLRAYLVVIRRVGVDGKMTIQSMCYTAPSFSHVAAKYDRPEDGVEIMKQEFLAMGEISLMPLAWKSRLAEITDLNGLNMCYNCAHDFRMQPNQRCLRGHRMESEPATIICKGFEPKVKE